MQYIEAPAKQRIQATSIFLAGGISNCPDWQAEMVATLANETLTLINPRRADFPMHDPTAAPLQIEWEFQHLRLADAILFWFPKETLCPITLFELGAQSRGEKPLFVGVHPAYQRRQDVEVQLRLARPEVRVVYRLEDLAGQVQAWIKESEN